jgi:lysophospholipase L1-like esterase
MRRMRSRALVFASIALASVTCARPAATVSAPPADDWVATWEAPPQLTEPRNMPPAPGLSQHAIRQNIRVTLGGSRWRFRFSNEFGDAPLTITSTYVARSLGDATIDPASAVLLHFSELGSVVTIPPGGAVTSDEIAMSVPPLSNLAITTDFETVPRDLTGHPGSRTTSYVIDRRLQDRIRLTGAQPVEHWYVISGAEVVAPSGSGSVVVLGNSIADGRGSGTDKNNRWPDNLAGRLQSRASTAHVGVLNAGIGGNAVLRGGLGPTALARLERDVLAQRGARWVIVSEGVNDIGAAAGPESSAAVARGLIAAYQDIIRRAHARGMRVYGATILPFGGSQYSSAEHELARRTVNEWIRASRAFDAVIDFDAVMRDRDDATRLRADGDSGDHLHPNERGYVLMAESIELSLFERR